MDLNVIEIVLLTSLVNSIFLLILVFSSPGKRNNINIVLTLFIFLTSLNFASWIIVPFLAHNYHWFCLDRFPVVFFLGPLFYEFARLTIKPDKGEGINHKIFIAGYLDVLMTVIVWAYIGFFNPQAKFEILFDVFTLHIYEILAVLFDGYFVFKAIRIFVNRTINHPKLNQVFLLITVIFFLWVGTFFADLAVYPSQIPDSAFYPLWLLMFYFNLYLGFHFLLSPSRSIYYLSIPSKRDLDIDKDLALRLEDLMKVENFYRDPNITLASIGSELGVSTAKISSVLKHHFRMSYYDFINKYRIVDTIKRFKAGDDTLFTIKTIADESGFRSKTTFTKAFKKETGMLPKEYISSIRINKSPTKD